MITVSPTASPAMLRDVLGVPFTDEQLAAATAPLEPGVVVAGAGSGKTTVMAARVVWLVATGQVAPEQVLGLTFTNKAAAELTQRGAWCPVPGPARGGARRRGRRRRGADDLHVPRVRRRGCSESTGCGSGVEPSARLLADATRFQVAERVLRRAPGPFPELDKGVRSLVGDLVQLDGELAEHLVAVDAMRREDTRLSDRIAALTASPQVVRKVARPPPAAPSSPTWSSCCAARRPRSGSCDFGDQLAFAARLAVQHPAVGEIERERYRVVLLDEYQDTSVAQKVLLSGALRRRPPGDRGG